MSKKVYDLDKGCMVDEKPKLAKWWFRQSLSVGLLFPLSVVESKVKTFCWQHGLECEVLKSGWLMRDVEFLVSGKSTVKEAKMLSDALRRYFLKLDKISDGSN